MQPLEHPLDLLVEIVKRDLFDDLFHPGDFPFSCKLFPGLEPVNHRAVLGINPYQGNASQNEREHGKRQIR